MKRWSNRVIIWEWEMDIVENGIQQEDDVNGLLSVAALKGDEFKCE